MGGEVEDCPDLILGNERNVPFARVHVFDEQLGRLIDHWLVWNSWASSQFLSSSYPAPDHVPRLGSDDIRRAAQVEGARSFGRGQGVHLIVSALIGRATARGSPTTAG